MRNNLKNLASRLAQSKAAKASLAVGSTLAVGVSHATYTMPTEITTAFGDIQSAVTGVIGLVTPIVLASILGFGILRLMRVGAKKAGF